MKLNKHTTLLAFLLFVFACAYSQDVHYNFERGANFSAYKTYQWVDTATSPPSGAPSLPPGLPNPPAGPPPILGGSTDTHDVSGDQLLDQDIKRAIDEQLAQKGLTKVDKNADLLVGYQAGVHEKKNKPVRLGVGRQRLRRFLGRFNPGPDIFHSHRGRGCGPV